MPHSESESSPSYFGLGDLQWLCMVTLFIASIVTLILYLVQYFFGDLQVQPQPENSNGVTEEADAVLGWALSLKSWKSQWRGAWCKALNDESRKSVVSPMTKFTALCKWNWGCVIFFTTGRLVVYSAEWFYCSSNLSTSSSIAPLLPPNTPES